jgi:TatD DNase family protein
MFVDSHCHLTFDGLRDQLDGVRERMAAAQVTHALCVCTTLEEFPSVHALASAHDNFWCSVGVHPDNEDSPDASVAEPTVPDLTDRAALPKVVAIGETGLDYYRLNGRSLADMQWQRDRFATHIEAARACGKPLIIHTRSASADTLGLLKEVGRGQVGGVFHCFTETAEVARAALDLGFYISFSGIVTFKNAQDLREVAAWVPDDRLLIETDSPYLAPVPHRGKTNEPAYVAHVAACLAQLRQQPVAALAASTRRNAETLFSVSAS